MREQEAFKASGVLPAWEQKRAVLDAERLGLHARALSVDADSGAGDVLELLDDQRVHGRAEKLGTASAAAPGPPSSTDRPALQPPAPGTTPAALAAGSSSPIAPPTGGVGR
ncbi:hypothetical protein [Nocardioides glacieisoli]|uniref:hypothetical protein n=1 Tax=Nocardioides glacieisoli TaxID=1168730 RepID=UPI001A913F7A|nr:hypothetical protein [Nocardioides glacieisoli]